MTNNPPDTIENAVDQHPAGHKVDAVKTQEENENTIPVSAPIDVTAKDFPLHPLKVKSCTLKLKPLAQLDIDVWCNKVVDYHRFNPPKPMEPPKLRG